MAVPPRNRSRSLRDPQAGKRAVSLSPYFAVAATQVGYRPITAEHRSLRPEQFERKSTYGEMVAAVHSSAPRHQGPRAGEDIRHPGGARKQRPPGFEFASSERRLAEVINRDSQVRDALCDQRNMSRCRGVMPI